MRKVFARVGYVLIALLMAGVCLDIFVAWRGNRPFYGENYFGQSLGTYSTALVLVIAAAIGVVRLTQIFRARRRDIDK